MFRRVFRFFVIVLVVAGIAIAGGAIYARTQLRASLPQLDGRIAVSGLGADVRVDRDALGVPTITGSSREDAARGLGFMHAQDRFFQMDLQRRQPAGELAALVGPRLPFAVATDPHPTTHELKMGGPPPRDEGATRHRGAPTRVPLPIARRHANPTTD